MGEELLEAVGSPDCQKARDSRIAGHLPGHAAYLGERTCSHTDPLRMLRLSYGMPASRPRADVYMQAIEASVFHAVNSRTRKILEGPRTLVEVDGTAVVPKTRRGTLGTRTHQRSFTTGPVEPSEGG